MPTNDYNFYNELTNIMDISAIVHNERVRIDNKAMGINNALDSQNRMIFLNQSYTNRMKEYSFMIMVIALTIVIIVFTLVFKNILPAALVNIIVFIVGSIGGIWALWIYIGIQSRDTVDFDKVYSIPPSDGSGNVYINSISTATSNRDALGRLWNGVCEGRDCCDPETTIYTEGQCRPKPQTFTSIEQAYNNGEFTGNILQNYNFMKSSLIFSSYP